MIIVSFEASSCGSQSPFLLHKGLLTFNTIQLPLLLFMFMQTLWVCEMKLSSLFIPISLTELLCLLFAQCGIQPLYTSQVQVLYIQPHVKTNLASFNFSSNFPIESIFLVQLGSVKTRLLRTCSCGDRKEVVKDSSQRKRKLLFSGQTPQEMPPICRVGRKALGCGRTPLPEHKKLVNRKKPFFDQI